MASPEIVVASFWVHWPKVFPMETKANDYAAMLKVLQRSCDRWGYRHVVLTDWDTSARVSALGIESYGIDLPKNLMLAVTKVQAAWLASPHSEGQDTLFVGADTIIRRDIRGHVPEGDLAVGFMKDHPRWRINTGFLYVPARSREKVTPLFDKVARDVQGRMCDDMAAMERALVPMPPDYGPADRRGLTVNFAAMEKWNFPPRSPTETGDDAFICHFYGPKSKVHFFEWAKANGFA